MSQQRRPAITAGTVARDFDAVEAEFERNFAERSDVGAAFAAVRDREFIVDLWGGLHDRRSGRPWESDTLQLIFSGTKGLVAICLLILIERGRLRLDAPVADYWPEFAKEDILVRDVAGHTSRLPGIDAPIGFDELRQGEHVASLLAAQAPSTDPRTAFCYHGLTFGWLCGELVRRVSGRSVGRFFAEEVAAPLGLDVWIGLPEEQEGRVSTLELAPTWPVSPHLQPETLACDPLLRSIWGNPPVFARGRFPWNDCAYRSAEIPALGGIGTARSIARLYAGLDRVLSAETLELARTTLSAGWDEAHREERRFGVGFQLQTEVKALGPPPDAFGHGGAGGSVHGYWPSHRIAFSYVTNLMRDDSDQRARSLLGALYDAVISSE